MRTRGPLPGMDPWLEHFWESVHPWLIAGICEQLQSRLPDDLFADIEVNIYVLDEIEDGEHGRARPDMAVLRSDSRRDGRRSEGGNLAVAEPIRVKIEQEPVEEGHIAIRSLRDGQPLVTAIEIISPTNKSTRKGRQMYVGKREAYYAAGANVVEIDLLRAGEHLIDVPPHKLKPEELTPYRACVRRYADPNDEVEIEAEYYPLPLRDRLPRIWLPLRATDADLALDLQEPIDQLFERGPYLRRIDYGRPVDPPFSAEDAAWAAELITAGKAS